MFKAALNKYRLVKLQRVRAQVSTDYEAERARLLASGMSEEEAATQAGQMHKGDFRATHTNVVVFQSDRLLEQAERLQVPVPEDEQHWIRLKYAPHRHLTEEGQVILRSRIREEQKARREVASYWFNIITVILSLLVAIFAVFK